MYRGKATVGAGKAVNRAAIVCLKRNFGRVYLFFLPDISRFLNFPESSGCFRKYLSLLKGISDYISLPKL